MPRIGAEDSDGGDGGGVGIDLGPLDVREVYGFLMSAVVPRPIGLVTTLGPGGGVNAAPFSSLIALSPAPPLVGFVVGGWEGQPKDTLVNIERSGEFVVNIVSEAMAAIVEHCAAPLPPWQSELAGTGIATAPSSVVAPPCLALAPLALECRLDKIVPFGAAPDRLIAGRIVHVRAAAGVWRDGRLDRAAWAPLGRLGGGAFARLGTLPRPD